MLQIPAQSPKSKEAEVPRKDQQPLVYAHLVITLKSVGVRGNREARNAKISAALIRTLTSLSITLGHHEIGYVEGTSE